MLRYPLIVLAAATSTSVFASVAVFAAADIAPLDVEGGAHAVQVAEAPAMKIDALAF
ncbi:MAG: hypothetical protein AAFN79_05620 [Pseudomonadota bacterium]